MSLDMETEAKRHIQSEVRRVLRDIAERTDGPCHTSPYELLNDAEDVLQRVLKFLEQDARA